MPSEQKETERFRRQKGAAHDKHAAMQDWMITIGCCDADADSPYAAAASG